MCLTSSKFTSLVQSCMKWDLTLGYPEDCSSKLSKFSSTVKIINSLKMSFRFNFEYKKHNCSLNEADFYRLLRNHPEIKSMDLAHVNSETLGYIGHFCTELKELKTGLTPTCRTNFRVGFDNLDTLDLNLSYNADQGQNFGLLIEHLSALPKLRRLILKNEDIAEIDYETIASTDNTITKMEALETLDIRTPAAVFSKIINTCSKSLKNIFVDFITDTELYALLDICPNLKTVALRQHCNVSYRGYSALFRKLGKSLEYIQVEDEMNFTKRDLDELLISKPTQLTVVILSLDYKDHIPSELFIRLIKEHGRQFKHLNLGGSNGLDGAVLSAIIENCPLVVERGEWNLENYDVLPADISRFVADCGASLKILNVPKTFTDQNLDELAASCPNLHGLGLYWCDQVTEEGLGRFLTKCKGLRTLDIFETKLYKHKTFIEATYPHLRIKRFGPSMWNVGPFGEPRLSDF